jgi:hypothetical protein
MYIIFEMSRLQLPSYRKHSLSAIIVLLLSGLMFAPAIKADSGVYGPENWLKTLPTPFTTGGKDDSQACNQSGAFAPIGISSSTISKRNLLSERFHGPKLFLPPRLVLGECAEFTVQGLPGLYVAIAMADKDSGTKPVCGHELKLGPDRKLVGVNKIPEQGVASISIEAPIQGDLVGSSLYFEAVVWSKPDFSDMQLASTVSPQKETSGENGVIVCEQQEIKKGSLINLGPAQPMSMKTVGGMSSGRP